MTSFIATMMKIGSYLRIQVKAKEKFILSAMRIWSMVEVRDLRRKVVPK